MNEKYFEEKLSDLSNNCDGNYSYVYQMSILKQIANDQREACANMCRVELFKLANSMPIINSKDQSIIFDYLQIKDEDVINAVSTAEIE